MAGYLGEACNKTFAMIHLARNKPEQRRILQELWGMPEDIYSRKYHKLPLIPVIQSGGKEDTVDGLLPSTESRYKNGDVHDLQKKHV